MPAAHLAQTHVNPYCPRSAPWRASRGATVLTYEMVHSSPAAMRRSAVKTTRGAADSSLTLGTHEWLNRVPAPSRACAHVSALWPSPLLVMPRTFGASSVTAVDTHPMEKAGSAASSGPMSSRKRCQLCSRNAAPICWSPVSSGKRRSVMRAM